MVTGKEGPVYAPRRNSCCVSTQSVATASNLPECQNGGDSILSDSFLTRFKRSCEVDRRDGHRSCSPEIRFGRLRAVPCAYLPEPTQPVLRPCANSFLDGGRHCHEWVPARSCFREHRTADGQRLGLAGMGQVRDSACFPAGPFRLPPALEALKTGARPCLRTLSSHAGSVSVRQPVGMSTVRVPPIHLWGA